MPRPRRPVISKTRLLAIAAVLVVALFGGACGSTSGGAATGGDGSCTTVSGSFTLVAKNIEWQDTSGNKVTCLQAKAGQSVTITVDNQDTVEHNLDISGHGFKEKTELQTGPVKQTLKFTVPKPGDYLFVCDIHANMEGTFKSV